QLAGRGPAVGDQLAAGRGEVVEHVLLALAHAGPVPLLTLLAAAAQAGNGVDAARLDPGQGQRRVARSQADVEPAVAVQDRGPRPPLPAANRGSVPGVL